MVYVHTIEYYLARRKDADFEVCCNLSEIGGHHVNWSQKIKDKNTRWSCPYIDYKETKPQIRQSPGETNPETASTNWELRRWKGKGTVRKWWRDWYNCSWEWWFLNKKQRERMKIWQELKTKRKSSVSSEWIIGSRHKWWLVSQPIFSHSPKVQKQTLNKSSRPYWSYWMTNIENTHVTTWKWRKLI